MNEGERRERDERRDGAEYRRKKRKIKISRGS